jgi:hypothetical protein
MQTASSDYDNIYQSGRAVSLLRKKAVDLPSKAPAPTLFEKLAQTASEQLSFEEVDRTYRQIYQRGDKRVKPLIVISYLESSPKQAAKSKWLKAVISASISTSRKQSRPRGDRTKEIIAGIKFASPDVTTQEICGRLDGRNIEIPQSWQLNGGRAWSHAYLNPKLRGRVKTYISKIDPQRRY